MAGNRRVTTLIPCAGSGERFGLGHTRAKHLLPVEWRGVVRPMVGHVMRELPDVGRTVLGVRPNFYADSMCMPVSVAVIKDSRGQADTLLQMLDMVLSGTDEDGPVLVLNCDAVIRRACLEHLLYAVTMRPEYCMACAVQQTVNPGFSYVNHVPYPTAFAEKRVISGFGMSGAWAFRSMRELDDALKTSVYNGADQLNGEKYLSMALNYLPGPHLAWQVDPERDVVDWNTPEALVASGARLTVEA